ncbi:MAG: NusA-like transcription termination signal-binding factor [Candidatus Woesearchaeota archaeon]
MTKITYNAEILKLMTLFENITKTTLKDCFIDDNDLLTFVVHDVELGKAIGKQATNVKKIESMLKKKIRILGFNQNPMQFVKNLIYPISDLEITEKENTFFIKAKDLKTKTYLIGREQSNIKNLNNIFKKYFKDMSIRVV